MLPSLDSLRCFDAAVQLGSFRAAAKVVALTPAAVGQRIRQLEEQLGARLFARSTRSLQLTAEGLALVPRAREALTAAAKCERAVRGEEAAVPFELTVGTRYELGLSFLLPLRGRLAAAVPGMSLHFYFGSGPDLLLRLRGREIDCAVTSARLSDPVFDAVRLHQEDYALVASKRLLAHRPLSRAADAAQHDLIDVDGDLPLYRYWRDAPGAPAAMPFRRLIRVGAGEAIRQLVLAGEGVAVLPVYMIAAPLRSGALLRVLPRIKPLHDHFRLVFRADDPRRSWFEAIARVLLAQPLR